MRRNGFICSKGNRLKCIIAVANHLASQTQNPDYSQSKHHVACNMWKSHRYKHSYRTIYNINMCMYHIIIADLSYHYQKCIHIYIYIEHNFLWKKRTSMVIVSTSIIAKHHIDGWVQDCSDSIANTLELLQSCTKPSISRPIFLLCRLRNIKCPRITRY